MQADGRLIQHVQHAHQRRTDLGRQADALGFSAGKSSCRPAKGQVAQSHVHQEAQTGIDLLQNLGGDHGFFFR